jgi:hypothetical protein
VRHVRRSCRVLLQFSEDSLPNVVTLPPRASQLTAQLYCALPKSDASCRFDPALSQAWRTLEWCGSGPGVAVGVRDADAWLCPDGLLCNPLVLRVPSVGPSHLDRIEGFGRRAARPHDVAKEAER